MAVDERAIDRKLLAGLIARHGEPPRAVPLTPAQEERKEIVERRARVLAAADPALVARLEQHEATADHLRSALPARGEALLRVIDRPLALFDLDVWRLRESEANTEIELSDEIRDIVAENAPQAFLRDLHRPVQMFGDVELRRIPSPTSSEALSRGRASVREAFEARRAEAGRLPLASREAAGGYAELREILARPWADARPANPLPMPSKAPPAEDLQWFGLSGGYDPDA